MELKDFTFELPEELIAQYPPEKRGQSRLLVYKRATGEIIHTMASEIGKFLPEQSLIVRNNSRVRRARLYATSPTGKQVEFLLLRRADERPEHSAEPTTLSTSVERVAHSFEGATDDYTSAELTVRGQNHDSDTALWECMVRGIKKKHEGDVYEFPGNMKGTIMGRVGEFSLVRLDPTPKEDYFEQYGHVPLPPYVSRKDAELDFERYQTVYAEHYGSVAAPTAGLHFTEEHLASLEEAGVQFASVSLHVGAGTFLPIRTDIIEEHEMHREYYTVPKDTAALVRKAKAEGGHVIALGTTSVRTLESALDEEHQLVAGDGSTNLFIYPGYSFKTVDHLITNFHTPKSSLLVLVSAFAGVDAIKRIYAEALKERYRFFSYGDVMLIL